MPVEVGDPTTQNGRVVLTKSPQNSPGCCMVCGYADSGVRYFADWRLDVEWYGTIYICEQCVTEPCRTLGWTDPEEAESLKGKLEDAYSDIEILQKRNKDLENAIDILSAQRFSPASTPVVSDADSSVRDNAQYNRKPAARLSEPREESSSSDKSSSKPRSDDSSHFDNIESDIKL